jgi:nicotinate-nucleotide--dimethylbenzimidazole phosphoribosyltransferase
VIRSRRDVRREFTGEPVDSETLWRVLDAAHAAPSVGLSQPWDFILVSDRRTVERFHDHVLAEREVFAGTLPPQARSTFAGIKIEGILDCSLSIAVTCDPSRGAPYVLGRHAIADAGLYSSCLAIENLWLAATAEGWGVGWVSFYREEFLTELLGLPAGVRPLAWLCVGPVTHLEAVPDLERQGWRARRPVESAVHQDWWEGPVRGSLRRGGHPGMEHSPFEAAAAAVSPLDPLAATEAEAYSLRLTKPPGSLGQLERVGAQLAAIAGRCPPPLPRPAAVAVFAADHGVVADGVTPWPQEVTAQMVANFAAGGAAINVLAREVEADVVVVDVGVATDLSGLPGILLRKVRPGTASLVHGPAMTVGEARQALDVGAEIAASLTGEGARLLVTGDMGIGNTTPSAALIAALTGLGAETVTGRGTGIDDDTYGRKVALIRQALDRHAAAIEAGPLETLAALGGLEIAALAGFIVGGAAARTPVLVDGVIADAALLVAARLVPDVLGYCIAGHRSVEPGATAVLDLLGLEPLIDLGLRLGEGTGACLAIPSVVAAARILREMATFDSAGVTEK